MLIIPRDSLVKHLFSRIQQQTQSYGFVLSLHSLVSVKDTKKAICCYVFLFCFTFKLHCPLKGTLDIIYILWNYFKFESHRLQ